MKTERFIKATSFAVAFFIAIFSIGFACASNCYLNNDDKVEHIWLDKVIDGDTVRLKDGRKIRFSAINAPEIAHEDKIAEPYGDAAREYLQKRLTNNKSLLYIPSTTSRDNYDRYLGHLFLEDGSSIESELLRQGLAFQVFFTPISDYERCLAEQERIARSQNSGVWSVDSVVSSTSSILNPGFAIVSGRVVDITESRSGIIWVTLEGNVVLRLSGDAAASPGATRKWLNKNIEVRGWMVDRSEGGQKLKKGFKRWMILVYQKASVRLFP